MKHFLWSLLASDNLISIIQSKNKNKTKKQREREGGGAFEMWMHRLLAQAVKEVEQVLEVLVVQDEKFDLRDSFP